MKKRIRPSFFKRKNIYRRQEGDGLPEEGGSAAGSTQTAAATPATGGTTTTAAKEPRKPPAASAAAAGRATAPAAARRAAGSVGVAGPQAALGDTGSGTDGVAEPAAGGTAAPVGVGAAETEAVVAVDRKAERAGSARAAAASTEPVAVGGEGSAGCSMESGFAAHTHWDPAVRKEESAKEEGELTSVTKVFYTHTKIIFKRKKFRDVQSS